MEWRKDPNRPRHSKHRNSTESVRASRGRFDQGTTAAPSAAKMAAAAVAGNASQGGPMSGELLVTAIIVAKEDGTAADCSAAFNDFSRVGSRVGRGLGRGRAFRWARHQIQRIHTGSRDRWLSERQHTTMGCRQC
jgi:hypothetical protein